MKKYSPYVVFAPYFVDKHSDHINTGKLISKFNSTIHYYINTVAKPKLAVDITKFYSKKLEALYAHKSQVRLGDKEWVEQRNKYSGKIIGVKYGELFFVENMISNFPDIFFKI